MLIEMVSVRISLDHKQPLKHIIMKVEGCNAGEERRRKVGNIPLDRILRAVQ